MATEIVPGQRDWSMSRDEKGHREYKIKFLVIGDATDGPNTALNTPGLPTIGSPWAFDDDSDPWAFCRPEIQITPLVTNEPNRHFEIEFTYSTKPIDFCQDDFIDNPLLRPYKLSGSFNKYTEEIAYDRNNNKIQSSGFELIRGPQVEFDKNRPSVKIEQNLADVQLALITSMMDTLNDRPLWGLPARTIKLSGAPWERKFWGQCNVYYTRTLEFDIRNGSDLNNTFDRTSVDEGCMILNGHWSRESGHWILDNIPPDLRVPNGMTSEATTGGILVPGIYSYVVTAINAVGETTSTNVHYIIVDGVNNAVLLTWNPVPGATGYKIYTGNDPTTGLGPYGYLDEVVLPGYLDAGGLAPDMGDEPPTANTTGSPPNYLNPTHFIRYRDRLGELTRVVLDGFGKPAGIPVGEDPGSVENTPGQIRIEAYRESNFLLLGIPSVL